MNNFNVKILAADKAFYEGKCLSLVLPTSSGSYGVLAHHYNMFGAIIPGILKIKYNEEKEDILSISSGMFKIENNEVLILVDSLERPEEIDMNRAKRAEEKAREKLLQKMSRQEFYTTQARLARAINRLKIKSNITNNINH